MKIFHLSYCDTTGGASRAAYRLIQALRLLGVDTFLLVNKKVSNDPAVLGPCTLFDKILVQFRTKLAWEVSKYLSSGDAKLYSLAIFPSKWPTFLNRSDCDLVHLHWINHEMLSISDISKIKKPIVWTMHDMWTICGAEHVTESLAWVTGYSNERLRGWRNWVNRWVWNRKKKAWNRRITLIAPSTWLAENAKKSPITAGWAIHVIPNPIDVAKWKPIDQRFSREVMGLARDKVLLLFASSGGDSDPNKGFSLLIEALPYISAGLDNIELIILGSTYEGINSRQHGVSITTRFISHLNDDYSLLLIYNAVDAVVVPSRIESFGQVASEAHACGTPVVGFNSSGLRDIIAHKETGYLAEAFDVIDFGRGIDFVIDRDNSENLRINARKRAVDLFSYETVASKTKIVYEFVLAD